MTRIFAALALACALFSAGCVSREANAWQQLSVGVAAVVGETTIDPRIEKVSARLAEHCAQVQTAAIAVDLFAPDKLRDAAQSARIVVATFCAAPPKNVGTALIALGDAYAAIAAAKRS